ncbi:MAG: cohesin domain-containing protein [Anaerolineae bacterium]
MSLGFIGLIAANVVLPLLIVLGLIAIVLSDRAERRDIVVGVTIAGLALLAHPASVSLIPENATVVQGESISVTIYITNATGLYGVEVHLTYDDGLSAGGPVPGTCASDFIVQSRTTDHQIDFAAARMPPKSSLTGDCSVVTFTLTGEAPGTYAVAFDTVLLANADGVALPVTSRDGSFTVVAPTP